MIVIYQVQDMPMAEVAFADGYDPAALAPTVVPYGLPYWLVERSYLEEMYAQHGDVRDAWRVTEESIGRPPDGYGMAGNGGGQ